MEPEKVAKNKGYQATKSGDVIGPTGKKLSLNKNSRGYLCFGARVDGKVRSIPVHRFVAYYYLGDVVLASECVRHLDGNQKNNKLTNLKPGTLAENYSDNSSGWKSLFASLGASANKKLKEVDIPEIKKALAKGESIKNLASRYSVSRKTIEKIRDGKTWK